MNEEQLLERIPQIMAGQATIKGTRLTVDILNLLACGMTAEEILKEYSDLTQKDIQACLLFATKSLESAEFLPPVTEDVFR